MRKSDIEMHDDGNPHRPWYPAINVKYRKFGATQEKLYLLYPEASEGNCRKALEFAIETGQENFWDEVNDLALETLTQFRRPPKVYQAGRSGGWLIVTGLEPIEEWDAIKVGQWASFEKKIKAAVEWYMSADYLVDAIESNEWIKEGSEKYNFIDTARGERVCVADINQKVQKYRETLLS